MSPSHPRFDRRELTFKPLSSSRNLLTRPWETLLPPPPFPEKYRPVLARIVERLNGLKETQRQGVMAFGAHLVRNGLAPLVERFIQAGYIHHLATNGAAAIHDWELAYQGATCESVEEGLDTGTFGLWEETGRYINLAVNTGALRGLGYGEAVARLITGNGIELPGIQQLYRQLHDLHLRNDYLSEALTAAFLHQLQQAELNASGFHPIPHPFAKYSLFAAAHRNGIPITVHPMFGHDIVYQHPLSCGMLLGHAAELDFLQFAATVSKLEGGIYFSMGSAVMSPMIFEKSLAMARNLAAGSNSSVDNFMIVCVDLAPESWHDGEPSSQTPQYFQRFQKTFSRAGVTFFYLSCCMRSFLTALATALNIA